MNLSEDCVLVLDSSQYIKAPWFVDMSFESWECIPAHLREERCGLIKKTVTFFPHRIFLHFITPDFKTMFILKYL